MDPYVYDFCDDEVDTYRTFIEPDANEVSIQLMNDRQNYAESMDNPAKFIPKSWIDEIGKVEKRHPVTRMPDNSHPVTRMPEIIAPDVNSDIATGVMRDVAGRLMAQYMPSLIKSLRVTCKALQAAMNHPEIAYPFRPKGALTDTQVMQIRGLSNILSSEKYINPAIKLPVVVGSGLNVMLKMMIQLILNTNSEDTRVSLLVVDTACVDNIDIILDAVCLKSVRRKIIRLGQHVAKAPGKYRF